MCIEQAVEELFALAGEVVELDEEHFDSATAIAGCMPGMLATVVRDFARAGEKRGLDGDVARRLAIAGVHGAAAVIAREGDPEAVITSAATPGGMTAAAIANWRSAGWRTRSRSPWTRRPSAPRNSSSRVALNGRKKNEDVARRRTAQLRGETMKLTPLDIRHKEFKRGMRGYADVEVDEFLDEVADEYERIFKENIDLQDRVEALEDKVAGYKRIEDTLQKTLVNAQASAEEQKQNASKQAQLILQDAELKARQMVNEAYSERQAIEQGMAKLRSAEEDFRYKFKTMIEGYLRQIQDTPAVTPPVQAPAAEPTNDFTRHAEAIKEAIARESEAAQVPELESRDPESPSAAPYVAVADEAPRIAEREVPESPVVAPARGRGGVQSGTRSRREGAEDAPDRTMDQPPRDSSDDPEVTAARHAAPAVEDDEAGESRERIVFGETDDLLADVDTGVNENEFKW